MMEYATVAELISRYQYEYCDPRQIYGTASEGISKGNGSGVLTPAAPHYQRMCCGCGAPVATKACTYCLREDDGKS